MWIPWVWLGGIGKYRPRPSKLGSNTNLRPSAVGRYWAPISLDIGLYLPIPPLQTHGISPLTETPMYQLTLKFGVILEKNVQKHFLIVQLLLWQTRQANLHKDRIQVATKNWDGCQTEGWTDMIFCYEMKEKFLATLIIPKLLRWKSFTIEQVTDCWVDLYI